MGRLKTVIENIYAEAPWSSNLTISNDGITFFYSILIGGASGGDCWGGEAQSYAETEQEDFLFLQIALLVAHPEIRLRDYLTIHGELSIYNESHNEYYGNHTEFKVYEMNMDKIERQLKDMGYAGY